MAQELPSAAQPLFAPSSAPVRCWACLERKPIVRFAQNGLPTCTDCGSRIERYAVPGTGVCIEVVG